MQGLIINIPDYRGLKRKVEILGYSYHWDSEMIEVRTICRHYENVAGEYGDLIDESGIISFSKNFIANNIRLVDSLDGMEVISTTEVIEGVDTLVYKRRDDNSTVSESSLKRQFKFFDDIVKNTSINIIDMLTNFINAEAQIFENFNKK